MTPEQYYNQALILAMRGNPWRYIVQELEFPRQLQEDPRARQFIEDVEKAVNDIHGRKSWITIPALLGGTELDDDSCLEIRFSDGKVELTGNTAAMRDDEPIWSQQVDTDSHGIDFNTLHMGE